MNSFSPAAPSGLRLAMRFAWRELRGGLSGFYIFLTCIALGVAAITGVTSLSRSLTEGISQEGQAILGGDMSFSIVHRQVSEAESTYLSGLGQVSESATMRAMARTTDDSDQLLIELKAIDGAYPLYGEMELANGGTLAESLARNEAGLWGAVADTALLNRLGLKSGDMLSIGRTQVEVRAAIAREPDKLAGGMEFGPRLMISSAALPDTGLIQPGSLVQWHYKIKLADQLSDTDLRQAVETARDRQPEAGWRIRSRANAAPGLQRSIERFAQFLSLVGLTALVVGGVGVANAIRAFLETKRQVIASLKCLGATGTFAFQVYLLQILALTGIGVAIGLLIGASLPFLASLALQNVLPVQLVAGIYPSELGLGVLFGFLTALAFALWPLGQAHDVPPTALLRDPGFGTKTRPRRRYQIATLVTVLLLAGIAVLLSYDKWIAAIYVGAAVVALVLLSLISVAIMRLARAMPPVRSTALRLAIGNIHRPGALTPSIVLSLGLGLTLLASLALIDGNLRRELTATIADQAPSFFFVDIQGHEQKAFEAMLRKNAPTANIDTVPMLRGRIVSLNDIPASDYDTSGGSGWVLRGDRGITYEQDLPENAKLTQGTWWEPDYSGPPLVSFEDEALRELRLKIGDKIKVNVLGREITAEIANARDVEWRSLAINFVMVFSPNTFAGAPHSFLMTLGWDEDVPEEKDLEILRQAARDFPTIATVRVKDAINQVNDLVAQLALAIRGASSITLIASILVLAGALAAGHRSRIYDAVILKTLGATRVKLILAYSLEYALIGLATAVFALIAGSLAAWFVITEIMQGSFIFLPGTAVMAVGLALAFTVGFGLIGTWKVLGEKPASVLRNL
ncbi:ABC transporter permease [Roseibium sp. CAU 1637]|uniref:ABC transporter permease n=1 Tax=Roseibium limicola TaxID=2816037 RepID=A0A939J9V0_9HYPH|nr:ABC transporter permease [Roseibium limicola]MBO0346761.1 ABC transporter permease [Roseibium limicola]